jgi:hypothetical protein
VEYFKWDLPTILSQKRAELLKYDDNRRFFQSLMWPSPIEMLIAKGSSHSLVWLSTTRILSYYMTLFLVTNHERVRYCNQLLIAKTITIDDVTSPMIASTICKNASILHNAKAKYQLS